MVFGMTIENSFVKKLIPNFYVDNLKMTKM